MILIIILLALFTLIVYTYMRWMQLKQYWAIRQVPHTPPYPMIGSMTFILKDNISNWFRRMYNYCKAPYVGIWIFWRPALVVNSTEIAKNILIRDQANFRNRFATSGTTDPVGRLTLFTLDDPLWSVIRKRLSILFTGSKLRGIQNLITTKSKELVERIEKEKQKNEYIDLRNIMTDFSTDIVGTASFGVVSDATVSGTSHLRTITEDFMKFDIIRALSWCSAFFIPELVDVFRFKLLPTQSMEYMRKMLREIISQRGGLEKKVTEPRDLLDILIKIKQENSEELDMSENMMLAQAAVFLQGGFEAIAAALTFIIYELAFSPETQEKLKNELQEANDKYGDDLLDASVLSQLTYLNCVINEGLRKYPIFSWLDRVALEDYKVDDHLTITAGTPVYINVVGMHYDPEVYPEPDAFNPDRFLSENKVVFNANAYLPFGEGPRNCIGQRFGLWNLRHGLAAVILAYEVRPLPNTPKPSDVNLKRIELVTVPEELLSVEFVSRKNVTFRNS